MKMNENEFSWIKIEINNNTSKWRNVIWPNMYTHVN